MVEIIVGFAIRCLVSAFFLWLAGKLTGVSASFVAMLVVAAASSAVAIVVLLLTASILLGIGLSAVVMFVLLCKWTDANFWPDAVLMVVVSNLLSTIATWAL